MSSGDPGALDVVVLGAAGGTGRHVVTEALRAGHHVTATARDPGKLGAIDSTGDLADRLTVAPADVRDPESLMRVVEGHDVVVCAVGPPGRRADGLYSTAARSTVAAMRRFGVGRLVAVTSAGVRDDDPELAPWYRWLVRPLLRELYADMSAMEEIITGSDLEWTLVRPVLLLDRDATDHYRVLDAAAPQRGRSITRADVARFIVTDLHDRHWSRRAPTLAH